MGNQTKQQDLEYLLNREEIKQLAKEIHETQGIPMGGTHGALSQAKKSVTTKNKNPTRYRSVQARKKGFPPNYKQSDPVTPETRIRKGPICGAPRHPNSSSGSGPCCNPAGLHTDHPGVGGCGWHGGNYGHHNRKWMLIMARRKAIIYGAPIDISAEDALMQEVRRTAGHVAWLSHQIQAMDSKDDLAAMTLHGYKPSVILQLYQEERIHLVRVCKVAIDSGIAERQVQLAENQATLFAQALLGFIQDPDLDLTPAQRVVSREIMRKHLLALETPGSLNHEPQNIPMEIIDDSIEVSGYDVTTKTTARE